MENIELWLRGPCLISIGRLPASALRETEHMHVPAHGEAVDLTFVSVDDVGELVPDLAGKADGIHDGPPLGTGGDVRDPVDVADHGGGEVILGGARGEDDLGNPVAAGLVLVLVDQRREDCRV